MLRFAVVVLLAWTSLAASETVLDVFLSPVDYIDFTSLKSCFGEKAAINVLKMTLKAGRHCLRLEQEEERTKQPRDPTSRPAYGKDPLSKFLLRQKRNVFRYPPGASVPQQICNMRSLNLMTQDNRINTEVMAKWAEDVVGDTVLKGKLLESFATCKSKFGNRSLRSYVNEIEGFWNMVSFLKCVSKDGLLACQDYETRRYSQFFN